MNPSGPGFSSPGDQYADRSRTGPSAGGAVDVPGRAPIVIDVSSRGMDQPFTPTPHALSTNPPATSDGEASNVSTSSASPFSSRDRANSLTAFLTDGSIARVCDEMAKLTGVPIWLRDTDGKVIVPNETSTRWRAVDGREGVMRAFALVRRPYDERADLFVAPLRTSLGPIGAIVAMADWGTDEPAERRALERALTLMASAAAESCEGQIDLSRRVGELDALFRLSSLLVQAGDPAKALAATLNLALDVLGMDAGSISTIDEQTGELHHQATRNLSADWLTHSAPLSIDGMLRTKAMAGEVICVEDLHHDPRIGDSSRPRAERVVSLLTTGLIYQGRAVGLIRLYTRSLRRFTDQEGGLLRSIADHAAMVLVIARMRELRERDQQVQRQLRVAADVQRRMLPRTLPSTPRFDIAARYAPSYQLGGDFYDLFERRGSLGLAVGDVSGKGVAAALLMSAARASLRAYASADIPLNEVMAKVNRATARDTLESEFITLWCGLLDPASLTATFCVAGHDPALLFRPGQAGGADAAIHELSSDNMVLGIDPDQPYTCGTFQLAIGDVLVVYTDGLPDAADFDNRKFGKERITRTISELLLAEPAATASRIVEHMMWTLRQFCGVKSGTELRTDDVTLVVLRVKE